MNGEAKLTPTFCPVGEEEAGGRRGHGKGELNGDSVSGQEDESLEVDVARAAQRCDCPYCH